MSGDPHLLLAISGHGYGHLAQCAPVINKLASRVTGLRLTLMSALPERVLRQRIEADFTCIDAGTDPVLCMHSAWEVDVPASQVVFREFHRRRAALLEDTRAQLRTLKPDLVLANIPWLLLAAAARENIPAVALCSLNWAAVFNSYLGDRPGAGEIHEFMLAGYRAADVFLAPAPALPMPELGNVRSIGPIARHGRQCRAVIRENYSLAADVTLVLVALGGIATTLPLADWPEREQTVWLFAEPVQSARRDILGCASIDRPLIDILASVDAVITKPGYGTYTEAVCNGVPLLTLARPDWPETEYLNAWANRYGRHGEITRAQFYSGDFLDSLERLLSMPVPSTVPEPTGIGEAVEVIAALLPVVA
jgi:hypothetical protein